MEVSSCIPIVLHHLGYVRLLIVFNLDAVAHIKTGLRFCTYRIRLVGCLCVDEKLRLDTYSLD